MISLRSNEFHITAAAELYSNSMNLGRRARAQTNRNYAFTVTSTEGLYRVTDAAGTHLRSGGARGRTTHLPKLCMTAQEPPPHMKQATGAPKANKQPNAYRAIKFP